MQQTNPNQTPNSNPNLQTTPNHNSQSNIRENQQAFQEMYWTTAYIDGKYFIAHPLDLDKLIKIQQQIKVQKNKLKLPENFDLAPEKQQSSSIKSHKFDNRPESSISRDCKTEINQLKLLKGKVDAEKQLVQEQEKYKQKLEEFRKNRKNKNQWLNKIKNNDTQEKKEEHREKQKKQQNLSIVQKSNVSKKSKSSAKKESNKFMMAPHELKSKKKQISQKQDELQKNSIKKSSQVNNFNRQEVQNKSSRKSQKEQNNNSIKDSNRRSFKQSSKKSKHDNPQEANYISFNPDQHINSPRFELNSQKTSKKSEISRKSALNPPQLRQSSQIDKSKKSFIINSKRKTPSNSQQKSLKDRSNLKSASSVASKIHIQELNKKIKEMQIKLQGVEKRQTQLQVLEKSRIQEFSHLSPKQTTMKQIDEKQKSEKIENGENEKSEKSENSEKKRERNKRDTIYDLRNRKLNFNSSIVSYNYTEDLLKMKKDEEDVDEKVKMTQQISELKKIIRELKLERIKQESIIEQLEKKGSIENSRASRYQNSNFKEEQSQHPEEESEAFKKKTFQRIDSQQLPKKQVRRSLKLSQTKETPKQFRISRQRTEKSQPAKFKQSNTNPESPSYREFQPLSLSRKGIIVRQVFHNLSSEQQISEIQTHSSQFKHLPQKNQVLDPQSPTSSGKKIFQLQFIRKGQEVNDSVESEEQEVVAPNIDIEPFPIPEIPETPKSDINQAELLNLAKETCLKFEINIQKDDSLFMKKYKNCIIFKTPEDKKTIVWHYSGKFYIGGWDQTEDGEGKKNGEGFQFMPDKHYYKGQFLNGKKNGSGLQILTNGNIYQGQWVKGEKHGRGIYYDKSLNQYYEGEWKQNKKDGKGILKVSENQFYDGTFSKNIKHGYGVQYFSNGDKYRGQYKLGKFHGKGKYLWKNGSYYDGHFVDGHRQGQGKWKSSKKGGDIYIGQYKKDKKNGQGKYFWHNGCKYQGSFFNDLKHGTGRVSYSDGRQIRGLWELGKLIEIDQKINEPETESSKDQPLKKPISGKMVETPSKQLQSSKMLYRI